MGEVTKKQRAMDIFDQMIEDRENGEYPTNKAFRKAVIEKFEKTFEISGSSACTMYNTNRKRVEEEDPTIGLGRDPKKVTAPKSAVIKKAAKKKGHKVKDVKIATVTPDEIVGFPTDEELDRKVVNDTSGAVDLDPIASLVDYDNFEDDLGSLLDGMGYDPDAY